MRLKCCLLSAAELIVTPKSSVMYEPIQVFGKNLPKSSEVALRTTLVNTENKFHFESLNRYKTNVFGSFSSAFSPTLSGSGYTGVHTSGPLWSMRPMEGSRARLQMEKIDTELEYQFELLDSNNDLLALEKMTKVFMPPDIQRTGISSGNIQGALFVPKVKRKTEKRKAVITIFGGAMFKGAPEDMSAMLATEGFVTLALAFYGGKGQKKSFYDLNLDKLEEAVDFLRELPEVEDKRINLFGVSKGGDVCLALAAFLGEKIGGTVAVSSACASMPGPTYYKGNEVVKGTKFTLEKERPFAPDIDPEVVLSESERHVPVERAKGPVLCIYGREDKVFDGDNPLVQYVQQKAFEAGKMDFQIQTYEGLGHLLDVPNTPVCTEAMNPLVPFVVKYGGKIQEHSLAQIDAWPRL